MALLSLEYIFKILILSVVAAIIILTIINFYGDIEGFIKNWFKGEEKEEFPKEVTKDYFNSGEVATYIQDCYSKMSSLPEQKQKDIVCYILLARNGFSVNINEIKARLPRDVNVTFSATFNKNYVKIEFVDVGNRIIVKE
jgi:hypothetical protein